MNNEIENQKVINTKLSKMLITTGFEKIITSWTVFSESSEKRIEAHITDR